MTMKGGTLIVTKMIRLTSALVWVVMGTTCLESERTGQFQFYYYGRIRNDRVVGSLSKRVQRSKHYVDVPPPSCAKVGSVWRIYQTFPHCLMRWHSGRRATYLITKVLYTTWNPTQMGTRTS